MDDLHLSKSEIFFYGALAHSLHPLIRATDAEIAKSAEELFPALRDVWPTDVDPFFALEQLAIDFGIARRPELDPAGYDEDRPLNPEFRDPAPEDTVWTLADGSPASKEEFTDIAQRLEAVFDEAHGHKDETDWRGFVTDTMRHPAHLLDTFTGIPQWVALNLHQRCFKEYTDSLGPFVAEGESASEPGYVYRLSWRGLMYRYKVTQQNNHLYQSLVNRFRDELAPPRSVLLSMMTPPAGSESVFSATAKERAEAAAGRPNTPRLAAWLADLETRYGETPEWKVAFNLATAKSAARALERHMTQHDAVFAKMLAEQESLQRMSTRQRLDDFFEYIADIVEARVEAFRTSGRGYAEPTPEEMPLINARFLCQQFCGAMYSAAEDARQLGLTQVVTMAEGGGATARRFDQSLKSVTCGASAIQDLRYGSRDLGDAASNALRLAYGQLFFGELAQDQVYIDSATKAALLKQPRAVRAQLAEAISQFERQTLPNCTVTSACGLIEPVVRKMAAAWLPPAAYPGDTSKVLKALLATVLAELELLRDETSEDGEPSPEEADALLKLFCINVAFGLNNLGNTVRHHAEKVLKRHDAGVMLHGLCAILHRINS